MITTTRRAMVPIRPGLRQRKPFVRTAKERIDGSAAGSVVVEGVIFSVGLFSAVFIPVGIVRGPSLVTQMMAFITVAPDFLGFDLDLRAGFPGGSGEDMWLQARRLIAFGIGVDNTTVPIDQVVELPSYQLILRVRNLSSGTRLGYTNVFTRPLIAPETVADPLGSSFV